MNQYLLSEYQIKYPIFKILADYRYRKVGKPTVFDELLMSLAVDFPQLENNSISDIVGTMQVDKVFIRYTLKNLLDIGLIEHRYFDENLDNVRVSELVLTENGKKFYHEKKMPGKPQKKQEYFYVNPLSRDIITNKISEKDPKTDFQLESSLFSLNDETLQHLSLEQTKNFKWITADVELEANGISAQVDNENTKWQNVKIRLSLDQNRNLILECQDVLFKQWLNSRNSTFILESLLNPLLSKAKNALSYKEELDDNFLANKDLISFTLADKNISSDELRSTVLMLKVTQNNQENCLKNLPLIVLSELHEEATLTEQTLFIPNEWNLPENLTKIFVSMREDRLFAEYDGYLPVYFDHQEINLPIKYVDKCNESLIDLDAFKYPNIDTLVFLANFKTEQDILQKLPSMRIQQAVEFNQRVKNTWQKNFIPLQWESKIEKLNTSEDLEQFFMLFKSLPDFSHLDIKLQNLQIDLALKDPSSQAAKFDKLKDLVRLSNDLKDFNSTKLKLNSVNVESLNKLNQWEKIAVDFEHNYSDELAKRNKLFSSCKAQIFALFEPAQENERFAVLDTNYIINHSEKLVGIQNNRRLVLPKMVLIELDKLKKENQQKLQGFDDEVEKIKPILQMELEKMKGLRNKIKEVNTKLELLDKKKVDEINRARSEKAELEKSKKVIEKELRKIEDEQSKIEKNRKNITEKDSKIRKAAKQLSELKFEQASENIDILGMLVESEKAIADDKILAVACAYKLNDIVLYTGDNILKAKANSNGIKTVS